VSVLGVEVAKSFLDVIHHSDDAKLQMLLDGAEGEALCFMNRTRFDHATPLTTAQDTMPDSVQIGVLLLLQAAYQASPDDAQKLRKAAEVKLLPYRVRMGV
jgi:hypothetical protein